MTGFSSGWQGCSSGFPSGFPFGKSLGAALPALGKPRPSLLFYLDEPNIILFSNWKCSVWSALRFHTQSAPTKFAQLWVSVVPLLLRKQHKIISWYDMLSIMEKIRGFLIRVDGLYFSLYFSPISSPIFSPLFHFIPFPRTHHLSLLCLALLIPPFFLPWFSPLLHLPHFLEPIISPFYVSLIWFPLSLSLNYLQFLWSNILPPLNLTPAISLPQFHFLNFPPAISLPWIHYCNFNPIFLFLKFFSKFCLPNFLAPLFHLLECFTHNFSPPFWSMLNFSFFQHWAVVLSPFPTYF